ncbi:MAG: S8 family serine peptidase [Bdellovibrionaceae bacterium]|nr:S8 family serine peptidase [Bdellovibrio sp.]
MLQIWIQCQRLALILLFSGFSIGCVKSASDSSETTSKCQKAKVANQYIVHWKNSKPTLVDSNHAIKIQKNQKAKVRLIEPNYRLIHAQQITPEYFESQGPQVSRATQFFHDIIHSDAAWSQGFYGQGIRVAVVDTGVSTEHPVLRSRLNINELELRRGPNKLDDDGNGLIDDVFGWNFVTNQSRQIDESGHGTAISGIITGDKNNPSLGIAPQAQIIPIDFMNEAGGTEFHAQQALTYALARGAKIINNSWSTNCSELLRESFAEWSQQNVIFVNASGNSPIDVSENDFTPSSFIAPNIVNVGSSDEHGHRSNFSGFGRTVTLYAPGEFVPVIFPSSGWDETKSTSGTSFSAAMVSGAAALLWNAFPQATGPEIINLLHDGANQEPSEIKILDIRRSMAIGQQRFPRHP